MNKIWRHNQFPELKAWNALCDELEDLKDGLLQDFFNNFSTLEEGAEKAPTSFKYHKKNISEHANPDAILDKTNVRADSADDYSNFSLLESKHLPPDKQLHSWKSIGLKYTMEHEVRKENENVALVEKKMPRKYPTAWKLVSRYRHHCPIANYSILAPHTILHRHTGMENRLGNFIRIHIPLIVPEGDLFLEVKDEEVTWDKIFCFDNQFVHSAYNNTDKWRLIFLFDLSRDIAGIPPGRPYDPEIAGDPNVQYERKK